MSTDGWNQVADGQMPTSEMHLHKGDDLKALNDLGPSPPYEELFQPAQSHDGPPRLHILGATWGGVDVTAEVQGMIALDISDPDNMFEAITLNLHTVHTSFLPEPGLGIIKTLTVLYQYNGEEIRLLNATQFAPQITVSITPTAHLNEVKHFPSFFTTLEETAWRDGGEVEIIAVLYGTGRIKTPSVLKDLAQFFEGRRGQIRTTSSFFRTDPWVGMKKSWTVYFRLLNSPSARVRCVTGLENGALEVPWTRD